MRKNSFLLLLLILTLLNACAMPVEVEKVYNTAPLSVMVDGKLYYTGLQRAEDVESPTISGYICYQSVASNTSPRENDTSNFSACVGQPYAFVNGEMILFYNNQWNICYLASDWPPG